MIYKNFYNKYKMSQQINLEADKSNIQKDIENNNPIPGVLEGEPKSEEEETLEQDPKSEEDLKSEEEETLEPVIKIRGHHYNFRSN